MCNELNEQLLEKGISFIKDGDQKESEKILLRFVNIIPENSEEFQWKAIALCELGRTDEAIENIQKAVEIDANNATVWHRQGVIFANVGRHEESTNSLRKAIELNRQSLQSWVALVISLIKNDKLREALEATEEALKIFPNDFDLQIRRIGIINEIHGSIEAKRALDELSKS